MALLRNPSFETGVAPWQPENLPNAVALQSFTTGLARSGTTVLTAQTNQAGGSFRQDFPSNAPSVFAFAWVRASSTPVLAQLTLWDGGTSISTFFAADSQNWSFITNTIGLSNPGQVRQVRFEIYIFSVNTVLLVDSANAW